VTDLAIPAPVLRVEAGVEALDLDRVKADLVAAGIEVELPADAQSHLEDLRKRAASGTMQAALARRFVLDRVVTAANRALEAKNDPRRMSRVVSREGAPVEGVELVLMEPAERAALLRAGRITVGPLPGDFLLQMSTLPIAIATIALGYFAFRHEDVGLGVATGALYVVWIGLRLFIRRKTAGIVFGQS
jgi:hypothetical protein